MPSIQTWFLIGLGTLVSSAGFEQLRFMITKPHRKNALNEYWQHSLNVSTIFDYLLLPITYLISWLDDGIVSNGSAGSNSLKIAGRWINPFHEWEDRNTADIFAYLKWQVTRKNRNGVPVENLLKITLPVEIPDFNLLFKNCYNSNAELHAEERVFTVTWMGQSTLFVQIDGYNILTDPMFSSRTMGEWFGAKRLRPVPCSLIDLPPVDIVLVSHNHYDHLDLSSIYEIGNNAIWYVPKGLSNWLNGYGVTNVVDLDWWEEYHHDDNLTIVGLPCQHWSGRHFFDVNITLWSSFLVKSRTNSNSFFHCGDSGYCPSFKEVGFKYGPVTLAATRNDYLN